MKVRNGFVSNSSSSSYIILIHEDKITTCPTCKHSNNGFLETLKNMRIQDSEDTYLSTLENTDIFENLKRDIEYFKDNLLKLDTVGFNAIPRYLLKSNLTEEENIQEYRNSMLETIKEVENRLANLRKHSNLYWLNINYHDEFIKKIFKALVSEGVIEVIEGDNV